MSSPTKRVDRGESARAYHTRIDVLAHVVGELLFPTRLTMLDLQLLCMLSKELSNKLNKQLAIMQNWATTLGLPCRPPKLLTYIAARNAEMRSLLPASARRGALESATGKLASMKTEHKMAVIHCCLLCGEHGYRSREHAKTGEPLFKAPEPRKVTQRDASGRVVHAPWCRSAHRASFTCTGICIEDVPVDNCKLHIGQSTTALQIVSKLCHHCRHAPLGVRISLLPRPSFGRIAAAE